MSDCSGASLRAASRRITRLYDAKLRQVGLRSTQFSMMVLMDDRAPLTVNALAALLDLDRTTIGQNIRPLVQAALVDFTTSATDRRARSIRLTPAGEALLAEARPLWRAAQDEFERLNTKDTADRLRETLANLKFA
ncbi:MarR family winged helix-turn-helix transcriptional regulator [Sphingomonas glacialis]|uniref:MarR family transcriptional regulator n=1 Tax=Sphingomonas glacialis TaxID=658225 RepID=A0A502G366_9SPHN|nr:MarR family winged helix-turn-helix transcriptional regulator [Sphingomonas glacialis]TPG56397.1 MarR family transcriptional regulator [Sphingomonas glacialis]